MITLTLTLTLLCLTMSARAKLKCRRRRGSFLSKPYRWIWRLPGAANHTRCIFSITTHLAKGFKQNSPNWKSFRLLLWQNWRSTVYGKKKSGDFHSKSGDREIFIILAKIGRSPAKSGDLEALDTNNSCIIDHYNASNSTCLHERRLLCRCRLTLTVLWGHNHSSTWIHCLRPLPQHQLQTIHSNNISLK